MKQGEVELQLAGEKVVLKPTLAALRALLDKGGSLQPWFAKVATCHFAGMCDVVAAGVLPAETDREEIEKAVYEAGLVNLMAPLVRYLSLLSNGGREPEPESKKKAE